MPFQFDALLSLAISPDYALDGTIFAGTENNGLFISVDQGASWHLLGKRSQSAPVNQILLSPGGACRELIVLLGGRLWKSTDGGMTWRAWKSGRLGGRQITAALRPKAPGTAALVGLADGRILRL